MESPFEFARIINDFSASSILGFCGLWDELPQVQQDFQQMIVDVESEEIIIMHNITISIVLNKLVFSGNFPEKEEVVKEWNFQSITVENANIVALYDNVMQNIGWSSYKIEKTKNNIRISLTPIIMVDALDHELSQINKDNIDTIKEQVDKYVHDHKADSLVSVTNDKTERTEDLYAYVFESHGGSESVEIQALIDHLRENKIEFEIVYEYSRADDVGASSGVYEVIIFIQESVMSGVTYDLLKMIPLFTLINIKKDRVDVLTKKAAHYLHTQTGNIELTNLEECRDTGNVNMSFYFNRNSYDFTFNKKNMIINFKKDNV
jgi:hypothetical protein